MTTDLRAQIERVRNNLEAHRNELPDGWQDFMAEQARDLTAAMQAALDAQPMGKTVYFGITEATLLNQILEQAKTMGKLLDRAVAAESNLDAQAGMVMVPVPDLEFLRDCSDSDMQDGDLARQLASYWLYQAGPVEGGE